MKSRKKIINDRINNPNIVPLLTGKYHLDDSMYAKVEFDNVCRDYIDKGNSLLNNFVSTILIKKFGLQVIIWIFLVLSICLVISFFSLEVMAVIAAILCALTTLVALMKVTFTYSVEPKMLLENIRETSCYKGIIERIKSSNLSEIKYIYSNKSRVVLCDNADNTINISFKKFGFPDLSLDKQPLLVAGIINDICGAQKKNFKITNKFRDAGLKSFDCESENYTYGKDNYSFENLFVATNRKFNN